MRVHVEEHWPRDGFDIWFYEDAGPHPAVIRYEGDGVWRSTVIDQGQERGEPSLHLPRPMLEELIRASAGHVHAQDATVRHLDDAIKVRDRALDLLLSPRVEVSYPGNSPAPEAR